MADALTCTVVTPEQTALETKADFVALPLFDGEIGIAANHSPLIGRLGYGEMRIKTGSQTQVYYIDGGFVQVADNVVAVLTNRAVPAGKLDAVAAEAQLQSALERSANTPELQALRDRQIAQARAQIPNGPPRAAITARRADFYLKFLAGSASRLTALLPGGR